MSSEASRTRLRESIPRAELNGPRLRLLSAFHPSALYHLRASDSCFVGRFQPTFAFHSKPRLTHKPVGLEAVCGPLACFAESSLTDDPSSGIIRNVAATKTNHPQVWCRSARSRVFGEKVSRGWRPAGHPTRARWVWSGVWPRSRSSGCGDKVSGDSPAYSSSRCSIPCFETFASVIVSGIQSGLSLGASSRHAHPS